MSSDESQEVRSIVYTIDQTCILLKVARSTIYGMHHEGLLTIRKIGGKSVVLKKEIEALLENSALPRGKPKR